MCNNGCYRNNYPIGYPMNGCRNGYPISIYPINGCHNGYPASIYPTGYPNNGYQSTISNKAYLEAEINGIKHVLESNEVVLDKIALSIVQTADHRCVYEGEIVKYTIRVCNESNVALRDIEFKDTLASCTAYVGNSFMVDGIHVRPEIYGQTIVYKFCNLNCKEDHIITFEVKII